MLPQASPPCPYWSSIVIIGWLHRFCISSATFALFPATNINQQLLSTPPLNIQRRPFASASLSNPDIISISSDKQVRLHTRLQASAVVPNLGAIAKNSSVSPKVNAVLVSASVAILAGYHINLFRKEFNNGS